MNDWKVGDLVRLKSRGPQMTVTKVIDDDRRVKCAWFGGNSADVISTAEFPMDALDRETAGGVTYVTNIARTSDEINKAIHQAIVQANGPTT